MKMCFKLLFIGLGFIGFSAVFASTAHPFTVQSGNTCSTLAANVIGPACGGSDKINYIGPSATEQSPGWCTYKEGAGWTGSLSAGASGYYFCTGNSVVK